MTVDQGIIERARDRLYTVVLSDVLDSLAYHPAIPRRVRIRPCEKT